MSTCSRRPECVLNICSFKNEPLCRELVEVRSVCQAEVERPDGRSHVLRTVVVHTSEFETKSNCTVARLTSTAMKRTFFFWPATGATKLAKRRARERDIGAKSEWSEL